MADGTTNRRAHTSRRKARRVLGTDGKELYPDAIHRSRQNLDVQLLKRLKKRKLALLENLEEKEKLCL